MFAVKVGAAIRPQFAQDRETFFENARSLLEIEANRGVFAADAFLRVAHPGAKNGAPAGELIEGCPLQGEVEGVAGA